MLLLLSIIIIVILMVVFDFCYMFVILSFTMTSKVKAGVREWGLRHWAGHWEVQFTCTDTHVSPGDEQSTLLFLASS